MHRVTRHVEAHEARFETHPYFTFVADRAVPFEARRATLSDMAFFVLFFSDLNRLLLREDGSTDPLQQAINAHTHEDETHWRWYLSDLQKLGLDPTMTRTDLLAELFAPENDAVRRLCYRLAGLASTSVPAERHALIRGLEAAGEIGFRAFTLFAAEHAERNGRTLLYFGPHHLAVEGASHSLFGGQGDGPALVGEHTAVLIESATDDVYPDVDRALEIVDQTFAAFTDFVGHLHARGRAAQVAA